MRLKGVIADMEQRAEKIEFPKENADISNFYADLKNVVYENCGYTVANTLEYDAFDECYFVTVRASGIPLAIKERTDVRDDFNMVLERCVKIVPQARIAPQIEAIQKVQAHLQKTHNLLAVMLEKQRQGYKMVDLSECK